MTVAGHCGKCGAPYFMPAAWFGITPPPVTPTCACWNVSAVRTMTTIHVCPNPDTAGNCGCGYGWLTIGRAPEWRHP